MTPTSQALRLWRGDVRRWHHNEDRRLRNCGDTIHMHGYRCLILLRHLYPDAPLDLVWATALHDAAETLTGDPSWSAKQAYPELAWKYKDAEGQAERDLGVDVIRSLWVKLVDGLDAYMTMMDVAPDLMLKPDWQEHWRAIEALARDLGVSDEVAKIADQMLNP